MNKPLVTIVTVIYNLIEAGREEYFRQCLESVHNQTYENIEHIVIDGASTDNTIYLIEEYKEKGWITYISEKDEGIYDAMNKGIKMALGEWVYFLGSDDVFFDENVLNDVFGKNNHHINKDIVYGNVGWGTRQAIYGGEFTQLKLMFKNICHQAMFFKKDIFNVVGGYDIDYKLMADWIFNMRCFADDEINIKYINNNIAVYNNEGSSANVIDEKFLKDKKQIINMYFPKMHVQFFDIFNELDDITKNEFKNLDTKKECEDVFVRMILGEKKRNDNIFAKKLLYKEKEIKNIQSSKFWKAQNIYLKYKNKIIKNETIVINEQREEKKKDQNEKNNKIQIIPFYLDPITTYVNKELVQVKVGVHFHLSEKSIISCIKFLKQIPVRFDMFVSVEKDLYEKKEYLKKEIKENVKNLQKIIIEDVPKNCEHIAPFIVQFNQKLKNYDVICHISSGSINNINIFLDTKDKIQQILTMLHDTAKIIYFSDAEEFHVNKRNYYNASKLFLKTYFDKNVCNFQNIQFSQNGAFWAKKTAIEQLLDLKLTYDDFKKNNSKNEVLCSNVIINAMSLLALKNLGKYYCIYSEKSEFNSKYFETQKDYSEKIDKNSPKILSYYLPQFNAIPENDKWHEKGFTEWYKVRRANPLFEGHYQQHVPCDDISYYSLDSSNILQKQADMMKKSGVYGQIFYHYWFSGRLILEKPVKMLLKNKNIDMPFCFCWANENWTKKWQGNDSEVLLKQEYSEKDAREFIDYIIPFFKDKRYITIKGKPVLFIYQLANIENFEIYKRIWNETCLKNGLKEPYIIAVLNRNTISPVEYGVDAGVERVLHDWTAGNIRNIKDELKEYQEVKSRVFKYSDIVDFYINQGDSRDYVYFRSLIPSWDNTPRYHDGSHIVHKSNPKEFQRWLKYVLQYTSETLKEDEQFVVINAWNEWAEGAHIEPDKKFGYAYLNAIGRTLSSNNLKKSND